MVEKHDSQLFCIAQVSGLCDSVADAMCAKLESMTNELGTMSANSNDLSVQIGRLEMSSQLPGTHNVRGVTVKETDPSAFYAKAIHQPQKGDTIPQTQERDSPASQRQIVALFDEHLDREKRKTSTNSLSLYVKNSV